MPIGAAEDADRPVAHLPAVAVRAVQDVAAPTARAARDVGQLVGQPRGDQQPAGAHRPPSARSTRKPSSRRSARHDLAGDDLAAVAGHLLATDGQQLARRGALAPEVVVHVPGRGVAGLPGVDDQHRPPRPGQGQRPAQPGRAASDDHHVVPLVHLSCPSVGGSAADCPPPRRMTTIVAGMAKAPQLIAASPRWTAVSPAARRSRTTGKQAALGIEHVPPAVEGNPAQELVRLHAGDPGSVGPRHRPQPDLVPEVPTDQVVPAAGRWRCPRLRRRRPRGHRSRRSRRRAGGRPGRRRRRRTRTRRSCPRPVPARWGRRCARCCPPLDPRRPDRHRGQVGPGDSGVHEQFAEPLRQRIGVLRRHGVQFVDGRVLGVEVALRVREARHGLAGDVHEAPHAGPFGGLQRGIGRHRGWSGGSRAAGSSPGWGSRPRARRRRGRAGRPRHARRRSDRPGRTGPDPPRS